MILPAILLREHVAKCTYAFFPVRAQAQGSLCVSSQPLVALPRGPVGLPWRISFPTFKGKSMPSGIPTAVPGGVVYRSAVFLEEYAFLHLEKVTIFLVFCSAFWRHLSARLTLQKSTNESRLCLTPVVRRPLWATVGAKRSPQHTLHRRSEPKSQEIVTRLVKYRYFCIGRATFH